jgi:alpha-glucosidase
MVNLQGQKFPIWSGEQGIGRGLQPISRSMGAVAWPCSGDPHTTYSAVPTLLSSAGYGIALDNSQLINVDLTGPVARMTAVFERADSSPAAQMQVSGHIWTGFDVRSLLVGLTDITGRMGAPPKWTQEGLIIGAEGGHQHVSKIIDILFAAEVPVAGVWIQDWSGKVVTKTGVFVWWNWKLDQEMYPKAWLHEVNAKGIKVMTYINPFLTNENKTNGVQPDLFLEADRLGYLVQDQEGKSILKPVSFAKFLYGTVDVFNPEAHKWWINVIRCNVMMACEDGKPSEPLVHGWMHDYGEYLPLGAAAREGGPQGFATDLHNQFPRYSQETAVAASAGYPNVTFFARSGDLRSPGVTKMFWLGDQLTSYDACDGLQSALIGAMSGGLSGWTVNHADIGAFTMFNRAPWLPLDVHFMRDSELNVRWLELSVFINAIFRSHPGLNPDLSSQLWDQNILEHTRRMSVLFQDLTPYRQSLFGEAATKGLPLVRHGVLVQPDDPAWFSASNVSSGNKHCRLGAKMLGDEIGLSQFFFGDYVLVVPALQQGQTSVQAYIPEGSWIHFWLNKTVHGPTYSSWDTTLGKPNFFYRDNSTWTGFFRRLSERYASDLETVLV